MRRVPPGPAITGPQVDIIIEIPLKGIVLIERANPPLGWALPGGYLDYGESLKVAACREALEETSLQGGTPRPVAHLFRSPAGPEAA